MAHNIKTKLLKCGDCGRMDSDIVFRSPESVIAQRVGTLGQEYKSRPWMYKPACPSCHRSNAKHYSREAAVAK